MAVVVMINNDSSSSKVQVPRVSLTDVYQYVQQTCIFLTAETNPFSEENIRYIKLNSVCNLGQKIVDKLTKLSETDFSVECFTSDFWRFLSKKCQNLPFGCLAEYSLSNPSISGTFLKFSNFIRSSVKLLDNS